MKPMGEEKAMHKEKKSRKHARKASTEKKIKELEKQLGQVRGELEERKKIAEGYLERLMRMQAEFENYRKRVDKDREEYIKFASENIIRDLVDVSENLERAIIAGQDAGEKGASDTLLKGVEMTLKQLNDILSREGLSPIESVGKPFDPNYHEAVSRVASKDTPENVVVKEYMRGYLLNSKVIKPAKVEVAFSEPDKK